MREKLKEEWEAKQATVLNELLEVTYSYWNGTGHRCVSGVCVRERSTRGSVPAHALHSQAPAATPTQRRRGDGEQEPAIQLLSHALNLSTRSTFTLHATTHSTHSTLCRGPAASSPSTQPASAHTTIALE